ncbi:hypothetical protein K445DRAFT_199618 [Daldinia sp. EC12]|nr:hypothetical protein K445DRAFT_199618 [Daldinia sp. EC12]
MPSYIVRNTSLLCIHSGGGACLHVVLDDEVPRQGEKLRCDNARGRGWEEGSLEEGDRMKREKYVIGVWKVKKHTRDSGYVREKGKQATLAMDSTGLKYYSELGSAKSPIVLAFHCQPNPIQAYSYHKMTVLIKSRQKGCDSAIIASFMFRFFRTYKKALRPYC